MDTTVEDQHLATLRQTIADLEQRKVELLRDLTTLEAAVATMERRMRKLQRPSPPRKARP